MKTKEGNFGTNLTWVQTLGHGQFSDNQGLTFGLLTLKQGERKQQVQSL